MNRLKASLACLCLILAFPSIFNAQQGGTPPEVRKAATAFQAKDYDTAIAVLEEFFRRTPAAQVGRLLLGNAYRQKKNFPKALENYSKAAQFPPAWATATYNIACLRAIGNNRDEAFKLLGSLRGLFDFDQAKTDADLASLRDDPRFDKLFPKSADFVDPFVEKVKIIHEWVGETKNDQFGWIARRIGDVDGDKVNDLVTSAPTFPVEGQPAGRVYVYSGKTGKPLWMQTGKAGDNLGIGVEGAGDVNADGIPDVIAGTASSDTAYVYSGRDGKVLLTLVSKEPNAFFGRKVAGVGDWNGDGHADVMVGAPNGNAAGPGAGRAYLFSGKDGAELLTLDGEKAGDAFGSVVTGYRKGKQGFLVVGAAGVGGKGRVYVYADLTPKPKFTIESDDTGAALGAMFVSVVGDVNGDKVPDIYASDWSNNAKGPSTGRVYVHSGADGKRLYTLTGEAAGDGFGIGSADVGDVNRDGCDDLLIGAWQQAGAAPSGGKVYLYSGKTGAVLRTIACRIPGDTFGFDATGIGDVDGDGTIDFLLTSAWSAVNGFHSGRMFVISGK